MWTRVVQCSVIWEPGSISELAAIDPKKGGYAAVARGRARCTQGIMPATSLLHRQNVSYPQYLLEAPCFAQVTAWVLSSRHRMVEHQTWRHRLKVRFLHMKEATEGLLWVVQKDQNLSGKMDNSPGSEGSYVDMSRRCIASSNPAVDCEAAVSLIQGRRVSSRRLEAWRMYSKSPITTFPKATCEGKMMW